RLVHGAPDEHVVAGAGEEGVDRLDERTGDEAGRDLGVPGDVRGEVEVVDEVLHGDEVFALAVAGPEEGLVGVGGEAVDVGGAQAGVLDSGRTGVDGEAAEGRGDAAAEFGEADADDGGAATALPGHEAALRSPAPAGRLIHAA